MIYTETSMNQVLLTAAQVQELALRASNALKDTPEGSAEAALLADYRRLDRVATLVEDDQVFSLEVTFVARLISLTEDGLTA